MVFLVETTVKLKKVKFFLDNSTVVTTRNDCYIQYIIMETRLWQGIEKNIARKSHETLAHSYDLVSYLLRQLNKNNL